MNPMKNEGAQKKRIIAFPISSGDVSSFKVVDCWCCITSSEGMGKQQIFAKLLLFCRDIGYLIKLSLLAFSSGHIAKENIFERQIFRRWWASKQRTSVSSENTAIVEFLALISASFTIYVSASLGHSITLKVELRCVARCLTKCLLFW